MALSVLVAFILIDYLTGLIRGYVTDKLSSNTGFKGIVKKSVMLIVLIVSVLLDRLINNSTWVFRTLICYFYIANEGISILENCTALGLPVPSRLAEALEQLQDGNKKSNINNKNESEEI
ncbi:phage holin family protein [Paraclostridium ghonii]|uniref:phage holin family protein n=1 Tax=Paraclostridium ghonii TaxID=29358 RepID=UPI0035232457